MSVRSKIFNIIDPKNKENIISKFYDTIMFIAILVSVIPLMFRSQNVFFRWIEYIVTILFIIDYILRWMTADFKMPQKRVWAFLIYPFTLTAIVDLISILPIFSWGSNSLRVVRMWRLVRLFRIVKIFKYYEPLQVVFEVFRKKATVLFTVICFAIFYIFVTALFMFNIEQSVNPETGEMFFGNFFDALYWSTCTLTTVGYGDIYPISDIGRVVSMISALVGIAIIALPSGIITAGYMEEMQERKQKKNEE